MRVLRQFVQSLNEADEAAPTILPWEVIEFLVRMYADEAQPPLTHHAGSFGQHAPTSRFRMTGDIHVEWKRVGALYNEEAHALIVNNDASGDLSKKVEAVLHEIQHYNQHVRWDSEDLKHRDEFVRGKKLPPAIDPDSDSGDPSGLYEISWQDMTKFWLRRYGYASSPHEVDAREFASARLSEALGFIDQHFGPKAKKPKGKKKR